MVEAAVDIPVNLEEIEPKFGLRRNSTGSFGIETCETKVLPHYLQPSSGSCHDLCKYGCKRDPETNAKRFMPKTVASVVNKSIDPAETSDLLKKKRLSGTSKPPLDLTNRTFNHFTRKEISSSSKKVVSATNPSLSKPRPLKIKESFGSAVQPSSRRRFSDTIIPNRSGDFEMNRSLQRRNSETKLLNDLGTSKVSRKKVLASKAEPSNTKSSSKRVPKNQNSVTEAKTKQVRDQIVPEKTLYIIEPEAKRQGTEVVQRTSLGDVSSLCQSPAFKEGDCEIRPYRGGNEFDIQGEKTSSRRLRFRQREVLAEDKSNNMNAIETSIRRVEANGKINDDADSDIRVNLRHPDVEGKRDSQNLLNNMIEETASELVKTRKSRVMALVGAFETVISLQDSKYSQPTRRLSIC